MIPTRVLIDWRPRAPWPEEDQVEQDLVLTRALITLFDGPAATLVALRGGTALHKLALPEPGRYSEDIDLIQRTAGPIKPVVAAIQKALDPWLGPPATDERRDAFRLADAIREARLKSTFKRVDDLKRVPDFEHEALLPAAEKVVADFEAKKQTASSSAEGA